ncbi:unnamed protein product [Caenorhabditis auriculariae]|uniref:Fungal lipase-type domain-containing protein n=1 Tax=Caenorhabditis auriculariae TaxID=2777116 RepID=A0A8S1HD88_9PELO|nr:unnamed protein product [Caenorhabditis auriculariae]
MCHPKKTVQHYLNCPSAPPTNYNDTLNRLEVSYYIQAANRVSHWSPVGAPLSCLNKLKANIEILRELEIPTRFENRDIGILIAVNHDRRHIVVAFRSTNDIVQFMTQYLTFALGMMDESPFGGKMNSYYARAYQDILNYGFDDYLKEDMRKYLGYSIFVTGHSLGGTLANIFALHIAMKLGRNDVTVYSWSSPRSGDETFTQLYHQYVPIAFRIVRDGDFVADLPFRISQTIPTPHHNGFEIFYQSHMLSENYVVCNQPETEYCLKGQWYKKPVSHMYLFDQNYANYKLGFCE